MKPWPTGMDVVVKNSFIQFRLVELLVARERRFGSAATVGGTGKSLFRSRSDDVPVRRRAVDHAHVGAGFDRRHSDR